MMCDGVSESGGFTTLEVDWLRVLSRADSQCQRDDDSSMRALEYLNNIGVVRVVSETSQMIRLRLTRPRDEETRNRVVQTPEQAQKARTDALVASHTGADDRKEG